MIPRCIRLRSILVLVPLLLALDCSAPRAQEVSCETGNPCLVGVCLENGTCETSPGNDGADCDTLSECTTGKCQSGVCIETPANNGSACESTNACAEKNGTCSAGECVSDAFENGAACRAELLGPCLVGTCTQVLTQVFCIPQPKCQGGVINACQFNCNVSTGACEATPTHICDTACTTATCVPGDNFEYTCTDPQDRPDDTPCFDGSTCNGNADSCQSGVCTGGGVVIPECGNGDVEPLEECDDGDTVFEEGDACDADCTRVPCGKPTNSSGELPKASDALFTLKTSVGSRSCDLAVCDVNDNGSVTAADALAILRKAVGGDVTLHCPDA